MKDREERDGDYDDGSLPLIWVSAESRAVVGEIEATGLLALIDEEIAKKSKVVN